MPNVVFVMMIDVLFVLLGVLCGLWIIELIIKAIKDIFLNIKFLRKQKQVQVSDKDKQIINDGIEAVRQIAELFKDEKEV